MLRTYRAIIEHDRVEWQDEPPVGQGPVDVIITLMDDAFPSRPESNGQAMASALKEISDRGGLAGMDDPVAWQREIRADRPLPGREE